MTTNDHKSDQKWPQNDHKVTPNDHKWPKKIFLCKMVSAKILKKSKKELIFPKKELIYSFCIKKGVKINSFLEKKRVKSTPFF